MASKTAIPERQLNTSDIFNPTKTKELYNIKPHAVTGRLIDSHPGKRTKPMKVLCLGMSRTGTMSLFTGLQKLGYTPYHMAVALGSPRTSLSCWSEALDAKFNKKGKKWGREEFDKILGDYDAVADVPCICFAEELVAAYPDAKVVLQMRDVEGWAKSMQGSAGKVLAWNWEVVAPWDGSLAGPFWEHAKVVLPAAFRVSAESPDFVTPGSGARKAFAAHYELVRRVVPKERLLEYHVEDGYAPLCEFLNVSSPVDATGKQVQDMPRINDAAQFVRAHAIMWYLAFLKMACKMLLMGLAPVVLVVGGFALFRWQAMRQHHGSSPSLDQFLGRDEL